jgi:TRAP-type mannitol/chloroaromatic compound transport system substrate-binding protein
VIRRATAASAFETVQMRTFPADVVRAKAQATEAILQEIAQQSDFNKKVYDSFVSYRKVATRYAEVSGLAQHQARIQVLS